MGAVVYIVSGFGEFLFNLLWLAIAEGLTVEFFRSEIQLIHENINEHYDERGSPARDDEYSDEPNIQVTEKFPEYVSP